LKLSTFDASLHVDNFQHAPVQHMHSFGGQAFNGRATNVIDARLATLN